MQGTCRGQQETEDKANASKAGDLPSSVSTGPYNNRHNPLQRDYHIVLGRPVRIEGMIFLLVARSLLVDMPDCCSPARGYFCSLYDYANIPGVELLSLVIRVLTAARP